ncbi:acyl carrier protein [Saccharothrix sp. Mg75]|uniref:acyl carrier protein n=1 Tax=Saccharothrix sp. Mg75 TaxID=3445357 RepID=UPI003EE82983
MSVDPGTVPSEFIKLLSEIAEIPEEEINVESALKTDLEVDSLGVVELLTAAETQWGIKIPDEEAVELTTVGGIIEYIQRKL